MHHNTKVIDFLFNNSELFVNPSIIFDKLVLKWVEMYLFLIQSFLSCLLKKNGLCAEFYIERRLQQQLNEKWLPEYLHWYMYMYVLHEFRFTSIRYYDV